jgi:hypothetical protein
VKSRTRVMRRIRRMPQNLLRDRQIMEDILDEMATKWARKAERIQQKTVGHMQTKTK